MANINNGTYVSLHLTDKSARRLWKWGKDQGIESIFEPQDFHITVCYSKRPLPFVPLDRLPPLPVKPTGFDLFGKDKDYLVMKVESKLAQARHATARALGAAHDFPDYRPHISLAKGGKMPALEDLEDFPDLLFVNRESASVLNPSFKPDAPQYVDGPLIRQLLTANDESVSKSLKTIGYRKVKSGFGTHDTYSLKLPFGDKQHIDGLTRVLETHGYKKQRGVLPSWEAKDKPFISMHNRKAGGHYLFIHNH